MHPTGRYLANFGQPNTLPLSSFCKFFVLYLYERYKLVCIICVLVIRAYFFFGIVLTQSRTYLDYMQFSF